MNKIAEKLGYSEEDVHIIRNMSLYFIKVVVTLILIWAVMPKFDFILLSKDPLQVLVCDKYMGEVKEYNLVPK
jgi:hypothetical protein